MTAIPKPPKTKKASAAAPQLTEYDYIEIGERIQESMDFETEVEITVFYQKRYETCTGVIKSADSQSGVLTLQVGYESMKININNIVAVK